MSESNFFRRYSSFAVALINDYSGDEPFHLYLKKYFRTNKKHGSRDRREISNLCYNYFRLGSSVKADLSIDERIALANQIISGEPSELDERIRQHAVLIDPLKFFPFNEELSKEISIEAFNKSFLIQPMVFIRIRPGYESKVINKLTKEGISFTRFSDHSIGFESNVAVDKIFKLNKEVVLQDISSQEVSSFFRNLRFSKTESLKIWDACAGSGGKSILANDYFAKADLTVSDVRRSILNNLHKRFRQAGLKDYHWFVADLLTDFKKNDEYDLIIVDAPCSGSGTWGRTPEQLLHFRHSAIAEYVQRQKAIVHNCLQRLKKNGYLLYVTCSVFEKENENNVERFLNNYPIKLMEQTYLKGYSNRADTLYGALFQIKE